MEGRFYFILLILSVILYEKICASSGKSFDTLVRKKRLINHDRSRITVNSIHQVPYIVKVLMNAEKIHCSGTILTPIDILTAGHCVVTPANYHVVSNTIFSNATNGIRHNVTNIKTHPGYDHHANKDDLALIKIFPAIDFVHSGNRPIALHNEGNSITTLPVTSGWGCTNVSPTNEMEFPQELQSMILPIINLNLCKRLFQHLAGTIDDKFLCARDPHGSTTSCYGDSGNPLVSNNQLLGVMVGSARHPHPHYPDLFIKVYYPTYVKWINANKHHRA